VGNWSVVGEGCVVKNNQVVEDHKVVVGVPAKVVGEVANEYMKLWTHYKNIYVKLARTYPKKMKPMRRASLLH
jgi:carbonic anhydrase/acetyltransferase-like protein (isoleucine patch superfamily)